MTGPRLAEPSLAYPMGTDDAGRSVLDLVIWGSRISLFVGLLAAIVSMAVGSAIGIVAGYKGGFWDRSLMTFTDWLLVIPIIPLLIVLSGVLGRSIVVIIFVIGLSSWPWTARLVRSQTLSVKERPYIERARGLGARDRQLITRHVLPNVFPVIFANTILQVALMILLESTLAFLGLGDPQSVSWGSTLEKANAAGAPTLGAWWWIGFPGLCIVLVVLAFTMCGNALEEIVNPRLQRTMSVLEVEDLHVRYATREGPSPAVRGVSFAIDVARCSASPASRGAGSRRSRWRCCGCCHAARGCRGRSS